MEDQCQTGGNPAGSDIGGLLLSPVFYLVNFIADAIIDSLGKIMTGNGVFSSGIGILQMSPVTSKYTKTSELTVYISNALGFIQYPDIKYTPEEIFSGEIDLLSIDFISGKDADGNEITGDWASIRKVVAQWYKILRMIAIIGLLSVLIYTGIKVMISANAKDKAKYKEWIINWFMAVAILFTMHYIMSFIVSVTGEFSTLLGESCQGITVKPDGSGTNFDQFDTNLMGLVRFMVQSEDFYTKIAYEVMYIALIVYTVKFTVIYLKRVLNMAFLTILAPIVALTYPIDKINDGQAQGFNMWLKEYIFNALLQPMHLILYYILMGSAVSIAASNPLYGIVVLMFMTEAEKLLKKIFGFDKAGGGTVGGMTGAFAAGAVATQIGRLAKQGMNMIGGNGGKGGSGGGNSSTNNLIDSAKPEKDGSVQNSFSDDNMLDNGSPDPNPDPNPDSNPNPDPDPDPDPNPNPNPDPDPSPNPDPNPNPNPDPDPDPNPDPNPNPNPDPDPDDRESIRKKGGVAGGLKNVGKTLAKPIYDFSRDKKYNKQRWKRRGIKALKGVPKALAGFSVGAAAAAVQAGISITDGKYNPMEGIGTFAAGYAGGSKIAGKVGGTVWDSFKEGYYEGDNKAKMKQAQEEFMYDSKIHSAYKNKYDDEYMEKQRKLVEKGKGHGKNADELKQLASDHMLKYGVKDVKEQFKIQKMADYIFEHKDGVENYTAEQKDELLKKAIDRSRATRKFVSDLKEQGQLGTIRDLDKRKKYIDSVLEAEGVTEDSDEGKKLINSYNNAFKHAAIYQQLNS